MVKFDPDMMYFCLIMKIAADVAISYLETVLCQKKELDLNVYADRLSAIKAIVGNKVQFGETYMGQLHHLLNLGTVDLNKKT
ncbi:hypothetical protein BpHYR1_041462 [Brachionus plicatilis]|uniref:Uncharacterized protein n=1 Tax=Brachionus plicatilis TaxID=10195 RepID=A0A3M7PHR4_BRAPC|nr:hypothetical protein BpHYR1_041462 [Brachionus plicatilis]